MKWRCLTNPAKAYELFMNTYTVSHRRYWHTSVLYRWAYTRSVDVNMDDTLPTKHSYTHSVIVLFFLITLNPCIHEYTHHHCGYWRCLKTYYCRCFTNQILQMLYQPNTADALPTYYWWCFTNLLLMMLYQLITDDALPTYYWWCFTNLLLMMLYQPNTADALPTYYWWCFTNLLLMMLYQLITDDALPTHHWQCLSRLLTMLYQHDSAIKLFMNIVTVAIIVIVTERQACYNKIMKYFMCQYCQKKLTNVHTLRYCKIKWMCNPHCKPAFTSN